MNRRATETPVDEPLIAHGYPDAVLAWRGGAPITAGAFIDAVRALAPALEGPRHVLNACTDRYDFAVVFCAALVNGQTNLLPPSRAPAVLADLATRYPDHIAVANEPIEGRFAATLQLGSDAPARRATGTHAYDVAWPPRVPRAHEAAIAFTSGSTGQPQPQVKLWGSLVDSAREEREALALDDVVLVGTVSPQHMYGLESTVLLALHGGIAFAAEQPLHPPQIAAVLAGIHAPRMLVTTPVHLRALLRADEALPPLARILSATAPLALDLAAECEHRWHTQVYEIYGCTEAGQVATRRTVDGRAWRTLPGVMIEAREVDGETTFWAHGGHVVRPAPLADVLNLIDPQTFTLEARTSDLVNIAGKRTSLAALNHTLMTIDGVVDGVFVLPDDPDPAAAIREPRLAALVVAPTLTRAELLAELRRRVDPVFLPRPLLQVDALPRNPQGKLPRAELLALLARASASPAGGTGDDA